MKTLNLSRRHALTMFGALGALALPPVGASSSSRTSSGGSAKPLHELSVREALIGLARRDFSASEYVQALLAWQENWKQLNAYVSQDRAALHTAAQRADQARHATHPLAGLPIALKDNIDLVGYVTTAGTPALRNYRPRATALMLQHLIDQGAIVMGKLGLHELASGGTCANLTFGQIRNPYDLERIPGGSSGGTAVAVAARLVPAALGTDTGGSCRLPAALCGCVGFRPSAGRYDTRGVVPRAARRDTIGWMARSVADVELLDAHSGRSSLPARPLELKGLRLGVPRSFFYQGCDAGVAQVVEMALQRLREAGAVLIEADIPRLAELHKQAVATGSTSFVQDLDRYLHDSAADVSIEQLVNAVADPQLRRSMQEGLKEYGATTRERVRSATQMVSVSLIEGERALAAAYTEYFAHQRLAALVIPTSPIVAPPIPSDPAAGGSGTFLMVRNTGPSAAAGLPGLSLPAGLTTQELPVGIELDGPAGSDATLLRIAQQVEAVMPPLPAPHPPPNS